jgi:putative flavoprotein involved in K+ transport
MIEARTPESAGTLIIGAGQAGLSVGYHLARRGLPFTIVDGRARVGDSWRSRWDSLRLFTAARWNGLDGMPFPAQRHYFPTKDEMGDYLESYAKRFGLGVETNTRIDRLTRDGERFTAMAGGRRFQAEQVVVAMSDFQKARVPAFAGDLDPDIVQLHSSAYRNPSQLQDGAVLMVGGGNSGAEIGIELAAHRTAWLSGRDTGHLPWDITSRAGRSVFVPLVLRGAFHRVLTTRTPIGRKARPGIVSRGGPLIRLKPRDLDRAGVVRVPRTAGTLEGKPVLEDGRVMEVANVVWCTGYHPGFSWIDPDLLGSHEPGQGRGVTRTPGLFFVGLHFLHSVSSAMIHGVGRDADFVARAIAARSSGHAAPAPPKTEKRVRVGAAAGA